MSGLQQTEAISDKVTGFYGPFHKIGFFSKQMGDDVGRKTANFQITLCLIIAFYVFTTVISMIASFALYGVTGYYYYYFFGWALVVFGFFASWYHDKKLGALCLLIYAILMLISIILTLIGFIQTLVFIGTYADAVSTCNDACNAVGGNDCNCDYSLTGLIIFTIISLVLGLVGIAMALVSVIQAWFLRQMFLGQYVSTSTGYQPVAEENNNQSYGTAQPDAGAPPGEYR